MISLRHAPPGRGSRVTLMPIHRAAFSGSTRNSHTVTGLAAMAISRSSATVSTVLSILSPLLVLGFALERLQAVAPDLVEERLQLAEPLRPRPVAALRSVPSLVHQTGRLQGSEVLRDGRRRDVELRGALACGQLAVEHEPQDLPAARPGDRLQRGFHRGLFKHLLI